jgi:hypothetical protein
MAIAPATLPSSTVRNAGIGEALLRAAMNAPSAINASAGMGGNTFSAGRQQSHHREQRRWWERQQPVENRLEVHAS